MKTCIMCKQEFPKTLEYFFSKGKYLDAYCKPCNNKKSRFWYAKNSKKRNKTIKEWRNKNPDQARHYANKHRAKKSGNDFEFYTLQEVFETYGTNCYLCDMPINFSVSGKPNSNPQWKSGFHLEHFIPISNGGPDTLENVRPSHAWCNISKGYK